MHHYCKWSRTHDLTYGVLAYIFKPPCLVTRTCLKSWLFLVVDKEIIGYFPHSHTTKLVIKVKVDGPLLLWEETWRKSLYGQIKLNILFITNIKRQGQDSRWQFRISHLTSQSWKLIMRATSSSLIIALHNKCISRRWKAELDFVAKWFRGANRKSAVQALKSISSLANNPSSKHHNQENGR